MIDLCVMSQPRNTFPCVLQKRLEKLARTIVDADGSSPERQGQEVLLLYTFRKFLPDPILDRVGSVYLRLCCNDTEPANFDLVISLTTGYMEELLARSDIRHESSEATAIFEAWILLTNNLNRTGSLTLAFPTKMAAILESLICVYLSNASAACSQIFASSLSFAPEDLVGRILSTKNLNQSAGPSSCMIVHFLECDPCRFKPPFIELLSKVKNDKKLEGLWQAGSLDDALLCALSSGNLALDWNERRDQQIIELIMERALLMFTRLVSLLLTKTFG